MLKWIVWNKTVFDVETVIMLNWIVWNRTDYVYQMDLVLNKLQNPTSQTPAEGKGRCHYFHIGIF